LSEDSETYYLEGGKKPIWSFFENMFECYYCIGTHIAWISFLIFMPFSLSGLILFTFTSNLISYVTCSLIEKL
jgi:hypothetical protein